VKIVSGKKTKPRRTLLYGVHGIGKSTWAAQAPNCLLLNLEDGLDDIDCERTEHLQSLDSVNEALIWLANDKHKYQHIAIDSADWLEGLIHAEVAKKAGKDFADIGFGNGYKSALKYWDEITFKLDWLRKEKSIGVILLAHCAIKKHSDPETDSYDRYQPALHDSASAMLQEWCDEVLFASYRVFVRKEDLGFNKERGIAVGNSERYLRTQESAACLAKNRLEGMPAEIGFSWSEYAKWFPKSDSGVEKVSVSSVQKAG
jgi:hypothetical protein